MRVPSCSTLELLYPSMPTQNAASCVVLRLQADLRWLEACARYWAKAKDRG